MSESVSASEIYSHDGVKDSLTHLAAPPYFYENLRREIAGSLRSGQSLSIIKFTFSSDGSSYEDSILNFADLLTKSFREEDLIARLGKSEFVLLIHGNQEIASQLSQRFVSSWSLIGRANVTPSYAFVTKSEGESGLQMLNRLDLCALSSPSF
jgi:GGDEF domain-containing protein